MKADPSSHIWTARLPADLAPGNYRVDVEVVNRSPGGDHVQRRLAAGAVERAAQENLAVDRQRGLALL